MAQGEPPACVVHQTLEVDAVTAESSLERAATERESPCRMRERRLPMPDGLADRPAHGLEETVLGRYRLQGVVEISPHDRIEACVGRRDLALAELVVDDEGIVVAAERRRRVEDALQLRNVGGRGVLELYLDGRPVAARHQPNRAQRDG